MTIAMTRHGISSLILLAAMTLSAPALGQVVIEGGTVHTAEGPPIENGTVVIGADGTILAVGTNVVKPEGATVVDASGKIVTPGLIDASTSLGLVEIGAVSHTDDASPEDLDQDYILAALRASDAVNLNSAVIPIQRTGGVTSAVTVPRRGIIQGQSAWIDLGGAGTFATLVEPVVGIHGAATGWTVASAGGSRAALWLTFRELIDDTAFFVNNREAFDQNRSRELQASRLDLAAFAQVLDGSRPLIMAVDRASDVKTAIELARANGFRLVIAGGAEAWMVADELAEAKVPVIVDPMENLPFSFGRLGARADNGALLHRAGVPVIISTQDTHNVRNLRQMAGNAVRAGLPFDAALRAVTIEPARAYGMDARYGSLAPGKTANVVVWSGDPLEFSSRVERLWVAGEETSLDNRQDRLFERYRQLDRRAEPLDYPSPKSKPEEDLEEED